LRVEAIARVRPVGAARDGVGSRSPRTRASPSPIGTPFTTRRTAWARVRGIFDRIHDARIRTCARARDRSYHSRRASTRTCARTRARARDDDASSRLRVAHASSSRARVVVVVVVDDSAVVPFARVVVVARPRARRVGVDDRKNVMGGNARATRLRCVTLFTGAGAADYGCVRDVMRA